MPTISIWTSRKVGYFHPMHPYQLENERLRSLWARKAWKREVDIMTPGERPAPGVALADYARLRFIDTWGAAVLIQRWQNGVLTWRKLWRLVSEYAGDSEAQVLALKKT